MRVFSTHWPRGLILEIPDEDFYRERSKTTGKMGGSLMPTKNRAYHALKGGGKTVTARQSHFRKLIAWHCNRMETYLGAVRLDIEQVCRLTVKVGNVPFPQPDSDACATAIRDALQQRPGFRGLLKDDAQVVEQSITSSISTSSPKLCSLRIEITAMPQWGKR